MSRAGSLIRRLSLMLFSGLFFSSHSLAQSCAMCRTGLLGYGPSALQAMNWGIVLLLIPPVAIGTAIVVFAFQQNHNLENKD